MYTWNTVHTLQTYFSSPVIVTQAVIQYLSFLKVESHRHPILILFLLQLGSEQRSWRKTAAVLLVMAVRVFLMFTEIAMFYEV